MEPEFPRGHRKIRNHTSNRTTSELTRFCNSGDQDREAGRNQTNHLDYVYTGCFKAVCVRWFRLAVGVPGRWPCSIVAQWIASKSGSAFTSVDRSSYEPFSIRETGTPIGFAIEELSYTVAKWLRLFINKRRFATRIEIRGSDGVAALLVMSCKFSGQLAEVSVQGHDGARIGSFKSTVMGGGLCVFDKTGQEVAEIKHHRPGLELPIRGRVQKGKQFGQVSKQFENLAKEPLHVGRHLHNYLGR